MYKAEGDQDFKQVRENNAIYLRRSNREEIFSKRRNILQDPMQNDHDNFDANTIRKEKLLIVDPRYAVEIESYLKWSYSMKNFQELLASINHLDILKQHYGLIGVRKILSIADNPPIQAIIDAGLVPKMIEYVKQNEYPQLQLYATWALTNVASGTTIQCQSIIDKGGIPLFVQLLKSGNPGIVYQAIWAIGNISSDCIPYRDSIIKAGGLINLINVVENTEEYTTIKHGCWAISNICRGNPLPKYYNVKAAIPLLCKMIVYGKLNDKEIISDCCWAISYFSDAQKNKIQVILESRVTPYIINYLYDSYVGLAMPCIRIVGNISTGISTYTDELYKFDVLTPLYRLLENNKKAVRREVTWVISNIAAGTRPQVYQLLSRQNLMHKILNLFETDANEVRREICYIFSNISHSGDPIVIFNLYKENSIVRYYVNLFVAAYPKTVEVAIECLYIVLTVGEKIKAKATDPNPLVMELHNLGAIYSLEKLQFHESYKVYQKVGKLLQTFFELQDPLDM